MVFAARVFSQSLCWRLQPDSASSNVKQRPKTALFVTIFIPEGDFPQELHSTVDSRGRGDAKLVTSRSAANRIMKPHERTETAIFGGSSATPTFIGAESVFVGNIRGAGHFVVSGEVHGDGELQGGLNLSASGQLARIHPGAAGHRRGQDHGRPERQGQTGNRLHRRDSRQGQRANHRHRQGRHRRRRNRSHLRRASAAIRGKARS